jgi:serine/threonine protein kinase
MARCPLSIQPAQRFTTHLLLLLLLLSSSTGLTHLNSLRPLIIHRDLKLENILLQRPPKTPAAAAAFHGLPAASASGSLRTLPIAKISDFGLHVVSTPGVLPSGSC